MFSLKAAALAVAILAGAAVTTAAPAPNAPPAKGQKKAPKKAGKNGDTLTALFKKLDTNNDGKLSPAEFAKLKATMAKNGKAAKAAKPAKQKKKANNGNKAKKANKGEALFKKLDTNNDGFLSATEFKKLTEVKQTAKKAKQAKKANKAKK